MIAAQLDGNQKVQISFQHSGDSDEIMTWLRSHPWLRSLGPDLPKHITLCYLNRLDPVPMGPRLYNKVCVGLGWACCSQEDNICKETGRKVALQRALDVSPFKDDRSQRRIVWQEYHNRPGGLNGKAAGVV